ncbi:MAG TPA: HlyD family secretion protein [Xanthobacteraceae bacterium]|jgi:membrane fusion protein (multidrug efflux system)|nr:HlyD family secretion protein [Xanthobacteraceae bacterium]
MYRNRAEATSAFQVVPAGEGEISPAEAVEALPRPPQAEAPVQPLPVKVASAPGPVRKAQPKRTRRRVMFGAIALLAIGVAGYFGYGWWTVGRFTVTTDDAYVQAYNTTLAAKVSGYLASVPVTDNTVVHAGDVIATIDDGDYRLAVDSAREKVATQTATIARMGHQIEAQQAAVAQAKTQLASAQAGQTRAQLEFERQVLLVARDASSRQLLEQAQANRDQGVAGVQGAQAAIESAAANVDVLKGQQQEAISTLDELKTALAKAERDLSFTVIRAPIDGVIGNRAMQTGDFVQTGQRVASLVPLDDVFINANFKETQVARLRPGQTAFIAVDALPEHTIEGTIESFSPASGAVFSLLPPDNATGNFTKIVQRLPVRIHVPPAIAREGLLRPGMSVVVSVNTKADKAAADASHTQNAAR